TDDVASIVAQPFHTASSALHIVLPECQIEPPIQLELGRCAVRDDARHAVIPQTRRSAEDERITGFERTGFDRILPPYAAEQEPRSVAQRHRYDGRAGLERSNALVLVLMQAHPAFGIVVIQDTEIRRE